MHSHPGAQLFDNSVHPVGVASHIGFGYQSEEVAVVASQAVYTDAAGRRPLPFGASFAAAVVHAV